MLYFLSFRVILSDLAKYLLMTRSIAQLLCDSWASCTGTWWLFLLSFPFYKVARAAFTYQCWGLLHGLSQCTASGTGQVQYSASDTIRLAWQCVWSVDAAQSLFSRNGLCQPVCLQPGLSTPERDVCIRVMEGNGAGLAEVLCHDI